MAIRVTIWNEFIHEKNEEQVAAIYPDGIHGAIAGFLGKDENLIIRTATQDMPEHGLTQDVLDDTDVLLWWGHVGHARVDDAVVDRVYDRVLKGMGLICLHSAHMSKIFRRLMGTSCRLRWRDIGENERIWTIDPAHPIAAGVPVYFDIPQEEMYGERFDIPAPDELVFLGWFRGGEVFRSGCTYRRGYGNIFYFQPGHEMYGNFYIDHVQTIIRNAVYWAKSTFTEEACLNGDAVPPPEAFVQPKDMIAHKDYGKR